MIRCDFTSLPEVILGGMSSSHGINYYSSPSGLWNKVMPKPEMVLTTEIRENFQSCSDYDEAFENSNVLEHFRNVSFRLCCIGSRLYHRSLSVFFKLLDG